MYIGMVGNGCIIGDSMLFGHNNGKFVYRYVNTREDIKLSCEEIIEDLEVKIDEVFHIHRGDKLNHISHILKSKKYNIIRKCENEDVHNFAEYKFLKYLYSIGLDREITLEDSNYEKFNKKVLDNLFYDKSLIKYVKKDIKSKHVWKSIIKIEKFSYRFPNIYKILTR